MKKRWLVSNRRLGLPVLHMARMRFGLRWRRAWPAWADVGELVMSAVLAILAVAVLLLVWGIMEARDARLSAEVSATQSSARLAGFLMGGILTNEAGTVGVKCFRVLDEEVAAGVAAEVKLK